MELVEYRSDISVVHATAAQVAKDFAEVGIEIQFSGNTDSAYEELSSQLRTAFEYLLDRNQSSFFSLLYRIDLPQEKMEKAFEEDSLHDSVGVLTDLVLKREMMKVVYRKIYSGEIKPKI